MEGSIDATSLPAPTRTVTFVDEETSNDEEVEVASRTRRVLECFLAAYLKWDFPLLIVVAIGLAYAYPPLGAVYLAPKVTASWLAVCYIFLLSGIGLRTQEFTKSFKRVYFNSFLQIYNFMFVSAVVYGVSRLLIQTGVLQQALGDGMLICGCLPMAINVVNVLTASAGADEAAAIFNSAFANFVGIFLSPVLILMYIGQESDINLLDVFWKLAIRVVLPLLVGQLIQRYWKAAFDFYTRYKPRFKKSQEYALVFIVYAVFCGTFMSGSTAGVGEIFMMIGFQLLLSAVFMTIGWFAFRLLFRNKPKLRVMGLFGCASKTIALGVPLITSIYGGHPQVGLYTLPILIWHPMQLVLGSLLVPRLSRFVEEELERLPTKSDKPTLGTESTIDIDADEADNNDDGPSTDPDSDEAETESQTKEVDEYLHDVELAEVRE